MLRVVVPTANKTPEEMQTIQALVVQFEERTKNRNLQISRVKGAEANLATNLTKLEKFERDLKQTRDALIENGATFADPVDNGANGAKATKGGSKREQTTPSTFDVMGVFNVLFVCFLTEGSEKDYEYKKEFKKDLPKKVQDKYKPFMATTLQNFWKSIPEDIRNVLTEAEAEFTLSDKSGGEQSIHHGQKMVWLILQQFSKGELTKTLSEDNRAKFVHAVMPSLQALVNAMTFELNMTEAPITYVKKKDDDKQKFYVDAKFIEDRFKAQGGIGCVFKNDPFGAEVPITFQTLAAEAERKRVERLRVEELEQARLAELEHDYQVVSRQEQVYIAELERLLLLEGGVDVEEQEEERLIKKRRSEPEASDEERRQTRRTSGGKGPLQGPGGRKTSGPHQR